MSRVKNILIRAYNRVEKELLRIDQLPLWWLGLIIAAIFFCLTLFWERVVSLRSTIN